MNQTPSPFEVYIVKITQIGMAAMLLLLAGSCSTYDQDRNPIATHLDITGKTTRRYHFLAENPYGSGLSHEGYIVAIEKSPKDLIGYTTRLGYEKRFRFYRKGEVNPDRAKHLEKIIQNNRKAMFVSHILAYEVDRAETGAASAVPHGQQPRIRTRFLYNIFPDFGARTYSAFPEVSVVTPEGDNYYDAGWKALETSLSEEIRMKLKAAAVKGLPYTDLIIGAMGWDNDQTESVRRYNAIVSHVMEQSRRGEAGQPIFNPLFVGISWPSVWGWDSPLDLSQLFYKVFGYGNKADDADEIGYTYGNWLVNKLGLTMRSAFGDQTPPLRVIVFGHSFGARITSRAVFSRTLLREPSKSDQRVDLLVGLQGAFSIHRFISEKGNEGWPYAEFPETSTLVVMTWSQKDRANPVAYWVSRSPHIGGKLAYKEAKMNPSIFSDLETQQIDDLICGDISSRKKVVLVNASAYISNHNDILNAETGQIVWSAIRCTRFK